jgi:hypothetical protein
MRIPGRKPGLLFLAGIASLGLLGLMWAIGIGSSEAQQGCGVPKCHPYLEGSRAKASGPGFRLKGAAQRIPLSTAS